MKIFNDSNCLNRTLILFYLLNKYVESAFFLHIGVEKKEMIKGHSWLEYKNKKMFAVEDNDLRIDKYKTFLKFNPQVIS